MGQIKHTIWIRNKQTQSKIYAWAIHSLSSVHVWPLHGQSKIFQAFVLGISYAYAWVGNTGPSMELHAWVMQKSQAWS